jgi:hypothetical protein
MPSTAGTGHDAQLVATLGLRDTIDERLRLFKRHLPYHESDHVLNMTYNLMTAGPASRPGASAPDLNYLDAAGARRILDPTTAGTSASLRGGGCRC